MDVEETLRQVRERVKSILESTVLTDSGDPVSELADTGIELASLVAGLDKWLSTGGFLPAAWNRAWPAPGSTI